jgi:hypothetical protein
MTTGQFYKSGDKLFTTYDATPEGCSQLINDFYDGGYTMFYGGAFARSAGAPGYGDPNSFGMFNPKFGLDITAAMFSSKAITAALGKRAYDHEGMRLAPEFATYGQGKDFYYKEARIFDSALDEAFLGLGAGTNQDGKIPDSVQLPVDEIRVPYKELPLSYNYGLGLKALEGKDDTSAYKQYIDMISTNYSDLMDKTLMRPLTVAQPTLQNRETSLNGLARIFSSSQEFGEQYNGVTVNANMILPWGTTWDDTGGFSSSGLAGRRIAADAAAKPDHRSNYDAQVVDLKGGIPSLGNFDLLYTQCMQNWGRETDNKFWIMSPLLWNKLNMLCKANNIYIDSVYTSLSMGGIKTVEGRDVGMLLKSYNNIPIVMSGNASFDYTSKTISSVKYGDGFLIDGNHAWLCVTSPVEVWSIENPAIMRDLKEHHVMNMRAEVRADKFITSGRMTNIADAE